MGNQRQRRWACMMRVRAVACVVCVQQPAAVPVTRTHALMHTHTHAHTYTHTLAQQALFKVCWWVLQRMKPMVDYEETVKLLHHLNTPNVSKKHISDSAGWEIAVAMAAVLVNEMCAVMRSVDFIGISNDTSEAMGHIDS